MPNYVLQYDLSTNHIDTNGHASSAVYAHIGRLLQSRGWARHQYSCWRVEGKGAGAAAYDAAWILNQMEGRWGFGIFIHLHYERRTQFFVLR